MTEFYVPKEKDKSLSSKIILSFFKLECLAKVWNWRMFSDCLLWMNKLVMLL